MGNSFEEKFNKEEADRALARIKRIDKENNDKWNEAMRYRVSLYSDGVKIAEYITANEPREYDGSWNINIGGYMKPGRHIKTTAAVIIEHMAPRHVEAQWLPCAELDDPEVI